MKRRTFLATFCAFAAGVPAQAQEGPRIRRIGIVTLGFGPPYLAAFEQGLQQLGYVLGRDVLLAYRFAGGDTYVLPGMVTELVELNFDLIVTESAPALLAAAKATKTIPIVQAAGPNPQTLGLAASLARPGGNVTGLTLSGADRPAKQLQLLKESLPGRRKVAVIYNPDRPGSEQDLASATKSARKLDLALQPIAVRTAADLEAAFASVVKGRADALVTIGHGMLFAHRKRIADFALRARLPGVFPEREFADDGGLMAYGPDVAANFRRAATYAHNIMRGAKPGDLPIEQPTKWGLVVNLRTAEALGIKIRSEILVRADDVIR